MTAFWGNLMISWCGHQWLLRVDSSPKVDLPQWRLWLAARSNGDRQFTANYRHCLDYQPNRDNLRN